MDTFRTGPLLTYDPELRQNLPRQLTFPDLARYCRPIMKMPNVKSDSRGKPGRSGAPGNLPALYGLPGITHGSGHILHLLSPAGTQAVLDLLAGYDGLRLLNTGAAIPCFLELQDGKFDTLVRDLGVEILTKTQWDRRKAELRL